MKKIFYGIILLVASFILLPVFPTLPDSPPDSVIRVLILDDKDEVSITLKGRYRIYSLSPERIFLEGSYLNTNVTAGSEGIGVGNREIKASGIKIYMTQDSNIYVDGKRFRGNIDIIRKENKKLMVINYIALEDYLYGVLYHEVSHRWPIEVLKAQAIAARTFALYQARQNKMQLYDLRSDIYSQVYGGKAGEKWSTTKAVDATRGKVLIYKGDIFPSYYHATCAGLTEDASNLWNTDMLPLKGVPCDFCKGSPHYRWTREIPIKLLESKLKDKGYKVGDIISVNILSKNISGRVDKLEIKDVTGVSVILTGKDFRQIIGPNDARSTKFDVSIKRDNLVLNGLGWGHGVGMCQWGAYGMARQKKKCEEILKYYYPGAEISTIDKLKQ